MVPELGVKDAREASQLSGSAPRTLGVTWALASAASQMCYAIVEAPIPRAIQRGTHAFALPQQRVHCASSCSAAISRPQQGRLAGSPWHSNLLPLALTSGGWSMKVVVRRSSKSPHDHDARLTAAYNSAAAAPTPSPTMPSFTDACVGRCRCS